jgi:hypothetical protein
LKMLADGVPTEKTWWSVLKVTFVDKMRQSLYRKKTGWDWSSEELIQKLKPSSRSQERELLQENVVFLTQKAMWLMMTLHTYIHTCVR